MIRPLKRYVILQSFDSSALIASVEEYLNMGYEPLGGVAVTSGHTGCTGVYVQAMFLRKP